MFANEVPTRNGIADALGVVTRPGSERVYYIEAKASRSDMICEKQRYVYARSVSPAMTRCTTHYALLKDAHALDTYGRKHIEEEANACPDCYRRSISCERNIDFYYIIVADGITVEPELYPGWGVLDERGKVIRRPKRMQVSDAYDPKHYLEAIAHVLVYKVFGKMYL